MQVQNLDIGVRRALVAYYRERGLDSEQAETKATENLEVSVAFMQDKIRAAGSRKDVLAAFAELKELAATH